MHARPASVRSSSIPGLGALAVLIALAVAVVALLAADDAAAKKKRVPKAPSDFFGVSAVRPTEDDFKGMRKLRVGTYRVEFGWPSIQARRDGQFNWIPTDERVRLAAENGLVVVPKLFGTPPFLTNDGEHIYGPTSFGKDVRGEWQDFVEAWARRYARGGDFWKENPQLNPRLMSRDVMVWNEPSSRSFWWPKANPKQFGALLRITREALDRVNKRQKIITGGIFGFPKHKKSMNAKPFLKKVYRQPKAKKIIDGVSVHPYDGKLKGVKKQVKTARKVMNKARDKRARIYIGEFGWSSGGPRKNEFVKSKKGQAKLLKQAHNFFLLKRKSWKIASLYWFSYADHDGDGFCLWCPKSGLVKKNGKLKPSGKAYKRIAKKKSR